MQNKIFLDCRISSHQSLALIPYKETQLVIDQAKTDET